MNSIHPQFIKDTNGKNSFVILSNQEYEILLENLKDQELIQLYDKAKQIYNHEGIPMEEAFRMVEARKNSKTSEITVYF